MNKFIFYDIVFDNDDIDLLWEGINNATWGRVDDEVFGKRDTQHGNFKEPFVGKLFDSYVDSLEGPPKDALIHGLEMTAGRTVSDTKLARYQPGDDLDWHCGDWAYYDTHPFGHLDIRMKRQLTCITYLNDDYEGGETEFKEDLIVPEAGKTLIFPAHWEFAHRGKRVIKGTKYVYINHIWF